MADVRIRELSNDTHSLLKIKAIQEKTTLENLIKKILDQAVSNEK